MKKSFLILAVTSTLAVVQAVAAEPYPLKTVTNHTANYIQTVNKNPKLKNDKPYYKAYSHKRDSLNATLLGKTIKVEIKKGLGYELVSNDGKMGKGLQMMHRTTIPVNVDLKVSDADIAFKNGRLMVMMYDNKGTVVDVAFLEKEQSLTSFTTDDEMIVVAGDNEKPKNPFTNGDVLKKGFTIDYHAFTAYLYSNITKIVITDYASNNTWFPRTQKTEEMIIDKNKKTFKGFIF